MVQFDDIDVGKEEGDRAQDPRAHDWMLHDGFEFRVGQRSRFPQHIVGNSDLPDVVQQGAESQYFDLFIGQPKDAADSDPERSLWNRQLKTKIDTALQDLTPRERMVFELRHYQGLRLRNIGEMLGTTEEAAKNCLFRATQKMRSVLGDFV